MVVIFTLPTISRNTPKQMRCDLVQKLLKTEQKQQNYTVTLHY